MGISLSYRRGMISIHLPELRVGCVLIFILSMVCFDGLNIVLSGNQLWFNLFLFSSLLVLVLV